MKKVLIIDDDQDILNLIHDALMGNEIYKSFTYDLAMDGLYAADLISRNKYDMILTDINLPGMSGDNLIKCVEENETLKDTYVIAISGADLSLYQEDVITRRASRFVEKPFGKKDILKVVDECLNEIASRLLHCS